MSAVCKNKKPYIFIYIFLQIDLQPTIVGECTSSIQETLSEG